MSRLTKEIVIFLSTLLLCCVSHKLDTYNTMTIYLLVRVWIEVLEMKG
ncbi:MAG: hypothetical protein MSA56_05375 [Clostridium sp.]|nr:hypothetical protein [Clostridium sp.]